MGTLDYLIIMFGLVFIADIIGDVFKSRRMRDCEDEKMQELEERVKKLEERLYEQKV
ncbi:MAG: hypothetical protein PHS42_02675 [Sulfurimonas sp.]|nr:hypothetical protein [Sulfurimonas sp.]